MKAKVISVHIIPYDNLDTTSAQISDSTQIGQEGTPCKFVQSHQCYECPSDKEYGPSDIPQCDGADTISDRSSNDSMSSYNSDEEADSNPVRAVLIPSALQGPAGAPLRLEVDVSAQVHIPLCVPLCSITNPRSGWNKIHNIRTFLRQVGPDIMILSDHWGCKKHFGDALKSQHYKVVESSHGIRGIPTRGRNGTPTVSLTGGVVAIVYNEENFTVDDAGIQVPEGIEAVWAILTPKDKQS